MSAPRRFARNTERAQDHAAGLRGLLQTIEEVTADGVVTSAEKVRLVTAVVALIASFVLINLDLQAADSAMQLIGCLAHAADPSSQWFNRRLSAEVRGLEQLEADLPLLTPASLPEMPLAIAAD